MKKAILFAMSAAALAVSSAASAQDVYLGGGISSWKVDTDTENPSAVAPSLRGGIAFNEHFSLESHLVFGGDDSERLSASESLETELDYMLSLFGRVNIPINDNMRAYGLGGMTLVEFTQTYTSSFGDVSMTADDTIFAAGVGFEVDVTSQLSLGGDYIRHGIEESAYDIDVMSLHTTYRF